jgi:hypothetical protein
MQPSRVYPRTHFLTRFSLTKKVCFLILQ